MKNILLIIVLMLPLSLLRNAVAQTDFSKIWDVRYGGDDIEVIKSFEQTSDGGFILGGYSASGVSGNKTQPSQGGSDYWIVKLNTSGQLEWEKTFGGLQDDFLYSAKQTSDGGYILGGYSLSDSSGDKSHPSFGIFDYWVIKTDSLGNKIWDNVYGGSDVEYLYTAVQTTDGGFLLGGYSYSGISGNKTDTAWGLKDYWIVKTDSAGNKLWDKTFGGTNDDWLTELILTSDNGFIVGGFSDSDSSGTKTQNTWGFYDYWVVKADSAGNKQWDKNYGGTIIDGLYAMVQTNDGGYLFGGCSFSGIGGDKTQDNWGLYDFWIIRTDSAGNILWDKDIGGTLNEEVFGSICKTPDDGFLITGASYSNISGDKTENNLGAEQAWMIKIDAAGNKIWDKTIFSLGHDETGMGMYVNDSGYVVATYSSSQIGGYKTQPPWNGTDDFWIIKLADSSFYAGVNDVHPNRFYMTVYPNPNNGNFFLSVNEANALNGELRIYNASGQCVYKTIANQKRIELSAFLNDGLYVAEWIHEKHISRKKFVVNKSQ